MATFKKDLPKIKIGSWYESYNGYVRISETQEPYKEEGRWWKLICTIDAIIVDGILEKVTDDNNEFQVYGDKVEVNSSFLEEIFIKDSVRNNIEIKSLHKKIDLLAETITQLSKDIKISDSYNYARLEQAVKELTPKQKDDDWTTPLDVMIERNYKV